MGCCSALVSDEIGKLLLGVALVDDGMEAAVDRFHKPSDEPLEGIANEGKVLELCIKETVNASYYHFPSYIHTYIHMIIAKSEQSTNLC